MFKKYLLKIDYYGEIRMHYFVNLSWIVDAFIVKYWPTGIRSGLVLIPTNTWNVQLSFVQYWTARYHPDVRYYGFSM